MSSQKWHQSEDPKEFTRGATIFGMKWYLAILLFFVVIGIGAWVFQVATASIKGRGEAQIQIESATNRMQAQAQYHERLNAVKGLDAKIGVAEASLADYRRLNEGKADDAIGSHAKEDARLASVVSGITFECLDAVAQYNANAQKINLERFRDSELPEKIETEGYNATPDMDCKGPVQQ